MHIKEKKIGEVKYFNVTNHGSNVSNFTLKFQPQEIVCIKISGF